MAKQSKVTVIFNKHAFEFTRATLEDKARRAARSDAPTASALHRIFIPGIATPVSTNWFGVNILDTQPITVNAAGTAMRGAYNPSQVMRAASQLADLGVKVESLSPSATYALWSKAGAATLKAQIAKITAAAAPTKHAPTKARKAKARKAKHAARKIKADAPTLPADAPTVE